MDEAFRTAVVPTARLYAEHITREVIARKLGWAELEFVFEDLEAFDERAQAEVDEILMRNDALLPDEARTRRRLSALPGGWGALTHTQRQMLIQQAGRQQPGQEA